MYIFFLLLLLSIPYTVIGMDINVALHRFKQIDAIVNDTHKTPSIDLAKLSLKTIHCLSKQTPLTPKVHAITHISHDPLQVLHQIKTIVETQLHCAAPSTYRLQGMQSIYELTKPFA